MVKGKGQIVLNQESLRFIVESYLNDHALSDDHKVSVEGVTAKTLTDESEFVVSVKSKED